MNITNADEIPKGYTRVTEILMPYKNFDNIPEKVLKVATERGSLVHHFCELYALNFLIEQPTEEVKPYFESFKNWFDEYVTEVIYTEERITSHSLFLTGQFDLLCKIQGSNGLVLVDYKTPENHDLGWQIQTAAYSYLLRIERGVKVDRRISLRLRSDGKPPKVVEYLNHENDERLYLNQLEIYRFFNPVIR